MIENPNISSSAINTTNHKGHRRLILIIFVFVLMIVLTIASLLVGIYKLGWENDTTKAVGNMLPLPAGKVGDTRVSYIAYYRRVQLLKIEQPNEPLLKIRTEAFSQLGDAILTEKYAAINKLPPDAKSVDLFVNEWVSSGGGLDKHELRHQAENLALKTQVNNHLRNSAVGRKLADELAVSTLAALIKSSSSAPGGQSKIAGQYRSMSAESLTPVEVLPLAVQKAFEKLEPGQSLSRAVSAPQGYFVGQYVKNDAQGRPLVKYALIVPTLDDWLNSQHINKDRHGYLSQIK